MTSKIGDERGSALLISVFTAWMVLMFATIVITIAMRETVPTMSQSNAVDNIAAANAGIESALAEIRATTLMGGDLDGPDLRSSAALPCGAFSGTSTGTAGGSDYYGSVEYFRDDPTGHDDTWKDNNSVPCDQVESGTIEFALITATGDDQDISGIADPDRTLEQVYEIARYQPLRGGRIRFKEVVKSGSNVAGNGCLTARRSGQGWSQEKGASLFFEECTEGLDASQMWLHRSNMTLLLAATVNTSSSGPPLCVRRGSTNVSLQIWLEECPVSPVGYTENTFKFLMNWDRQLSSVRNSMTTDGQYRLTQQCLKPQGNNDSWSARVDYGAVIRHETNCGVYLGNPAGTSGIRTQKTYVEVEPAVGNPALGYPKLVSSHVLPGMCLNVTDDAVDGVLILWYCELDRTTEHRENSRFELRVIDGNIARVYIPEIDPSDPGFCLGPIDSTADPSKVRSYFCGQSNMDDRQFQWEVHGATADRFRSNTLRHVGSGKCLTASEDVVLERGRNVYLRTCDGTDAQKWNVTHTLDGGGTRETWER